MNEFIIKGTLPTLNEIIEASKTHWSSYAKMKKDNTELVAWACKQLPPIHTQVNILITWYMPDKRQDKDNIIAGQKFILDGIVHAGVLKNDGWKEIGDIHHRFKVSKTNPRVHVKLIEVGG